MSNYPQPTISYQYPVTSKISCTTYAAFSSWQCPMHSGSSQPHFQAQSGAVITWLSWAAPRIGQEAQETSGDQKVGLLGPKKHRDPAMASSALSLLSTNKGPESQGCCEDVERTLRSFCSMPFAKALAVTKL